MFTKRKIIIGLLALGVLVVIVFYAILRRSANNQPQESGIKSGATVTIGNVEVNNFFGTAPKINKNGDSEVAKAENYKIIYFPSNKSFLLSIIASPFEENRQLAEAELLRRLNISKTDACKLTVNITTPRFANPDEAGQNFKLSFCQ